MRRTTTRTAATAGAGLLLAGVLAGCSEDDVPMADVPASTPTVAVEETPTETGEVAGEVDAQARELYAQAQEAMREAGSGSFSVDSDIAGETVTATGDFRYTDQGTDLRMQATLPGGGGTMEAILTSEAMYLQVPGVPLPQGREWLVVEADSEGPLADQLAPVFEQLRSSASPEAALPPLEGLRQFEEAGMEQIDGVQTTRYDAVVDVAAAAEALGAENASQAQAFQDLLDQGVEEVPYSLWVDEENLVRQYTSTLPTETGEVMTTGSYSDWGQPVDLEVPASAETLPLEQLEGLVPRQ